jgi:hypothetical protein
MGVDGGTAGVRRRIDRAGLESRVTPNEGWSLYLKFAGETLVDVVLTSFKEK